jgi:hypothetical protein
MSFSDRFCVTVPRHVIHDTDGTVKHVGLCLVKAEKVPPLLPRVNLRPFISQLVFSLSHLASCILVPQIVMHKCAFYVTEIEMQRAVSVFRFLPPKADTLARASVSYQSTRQVESHNVVVRRLSLHLKLDRLYSSLSSSFSFVSNKFA